MQTRSRFNRSLCGFRKNQTGPGRGIPSRIPCLWNAKIGSGRFPFPSSIIWWSAKSARCPSGTEIASSCKRMPELAKGAACPTGNSSPFPRSDRTGGFICQMAVCWGVKFRQFVRGYAVTSYRFAREKRWIMFCLSDCSACALRRASSSRHVRHMARPQKTSVSSQRGSGSACRRA